MLAVAQARQRILASLEPLACQVLPLAQTLGRRLGQEILAQEDQPSFASSAMDGYAVGSLTSPWQVRGEVAAGATSELSLAPGQACRIFTGASLPPGTVAVVPQEEITRQGERLLSLQPAQPGQHLRPLGQHVQAGQTVLLPGRLLNPADLGLIALLGYPEIFCRPQPRVALIVTGDELIEIGHPLGPAQVRNSNAYSLEAQIRACGGVPQRFPIVPDQPQALAQTLELACRSSDLVVTCGGASVGARDYLQPVLRELGAQVELWKVAMRPGKPLGFAQLRSVPLIALPGNPVSAFVTFELFVRPALDRLQGGPGQGLQSFAGQLAAPVSKKPGLRYFLRCRLEGTQVHLCGSQDSHLFLSVVQSQGLLELEEEKESLVSGTPVNVLLWPWVNPRHPWVSLPEAGA